MPKGLSETCPSSMNCIVSCPVKLLSIGKMTSPDNRDIIKEYQDSGDQLYNFMVKFGQTCPQTTLAG
jgi:hypothetical protein